jgi:hypothetical protein
VFVAAASRPLVRNSGAVTTSPADG